MSQYLFEPEQIATEWSDRICQRLKEIAVPEAEIDETRTIIFIFTRTAVEELSRERKIQLPYTDQILEIDASQAHQVIDLFLRGVNQVAKKLRDGGQPWDERKTVLETLAWKIFNLAKLLVGFLYIPNPAMNNLLNSQKDLQMMMKQSAEVLLQEELGGPKGIGFPFNFNKPR